MGVFVALLVGLSVMLCWTSAHNIRDEYRAQDWPVVQARIAEGRVDFRHAPAIGKHAAWSGWCASWKYAYDWHGTSQWALLGDNTPSTFAPGCFAYQAGAQQALLRHPQDTTLPVRVDPASPWHSSAQPAGVRGGDIAGLALGLVPAIVALWASIAGIRARPRPGAAQHRRRG